MNGRSFLTAVGRRTREILQLTAASAWRGLLGFLSSDNLTYAASIAYYALLSLFPALLLAFATLGRVTAVTTYSGSTCVVVTSDAGTREVPLAPPYFVSVDLEARRIELSGIDDFAVERPRAPR